MATKSEQLSGNNLIIVMVVVTIVVVGVTVLAGKALVGTIILNNKVRTAKVTAKKHVQADLNAAPNLVSAYKALGPESQTLSDALPTQADFPSLLVTFENLSNTSDVKIKSLTPVTSGVAAANAVSLPAPKAGGSNSPAPQSYSFTVSVEGSYASLTKLFGEIETSARPMRVTDIQLTGTGSSLTGQMDITTYYQAKAQLPFGKETIK